MNIWQSAAGMLQAELISADFWSSIQALNRAGITVCSVTMQDPLTGNFWVERKDWETVKAVCEKRGDRVRRSGISGVFWGLLRLVKRPVLTMGMLALLILTLYLPTRVLLVQVTGNHRIASREILSAAEESGIAFGASRRKVRSEAVKNELLDRIPDLQWAGVNTRGCVAVICVREKNLSMQEENSAASVCSIVATRDGVITSIATQKGTALCAVGQAVKRGELLISGYTDCGLRIRAEQASGEVFAHTVREAQTLIPMRCTRKTGTAAARYRVALLLGKKRINLWKDSRIWDSTCDRIYMEQYASLPGGFCLPLGIALETYVPRNLESIELSLQEAEKHGDLFTEQYWIRQMQAGSVLSQESVSEAADGVCVMRIRSSCQEMIGRTQTEQVGIYHGETG